MTDILVSIDTASGCITLIVDQGDHRSSSFPVSHSDKVQSRVTQKANWTKATIKNFRSARVATRSRAISLRQVLQVGDRLIEIL